MTDNARDVSCIGSDLARRVEAWLVSYGQHRSNLAGAIVVLDALKRNSALAEGDVFTDGEVRHGRGKALRDTLSAYGIPRILKDGTTTRGARASCAHLLEVLEYGAALAGLSEADRDRIVDGLVALVKSRIDEWLARHPIRVPCDPAGSAVAWLEAILEEARKHKSQGRVEQHLIGAKLQRRHPEKQIATHAAAAADTQTGRTGDFQIGRLTYHVTVAPNSDLVEKCQANLAEGLVPVVLVPRDFVERMKSLSTGPGIEGRVHVFGIEDFVAQNVLEMATDAGLEALQLLREIVGIYNSRVGEAEVDQALRIDLG